MVNRTVSLACGVVLLALDAMAQEPASADVGYAMTPERFAASIAALTGLIGAVVGGWALARATGGLAALVAGLIAMVLGGLVVATADGGLGSGNGLGGGVVAIALGAISAVLGGLARARARRTA